MDSLREVFVRTAPREIREQREARRSFCRAFALVLFVAALTSGCVTNPAGKGDDNVDSLELARVEYDLGRGHLDKGELAQAETFFRQALSIRAEKLGPDHADTRECRLALNNVLVAQGKSAEETIKLLTEEDKGKDQRQVGVIDAKGEPATFTGSKCMPSAVSRANSTAVVCVIWFIAALEVP